MKIIVVSDTHGNSKCLKKIIKKHYDADYFLHAGDSMLPSQLIHPFCSVKGNCDYFGYKTFLIIKTGIAKIFITHGHKYNEEQLVSIARANDCKIVIFGHTHISYYQEKEGIILLNPGSPIKPRGMSPPSYAIIYIENEKIDINFQKYEVLDE